MAESTLDPDSLIAWQAAVAEADRVNIFCHCHTCGYEWVTSVHQPPCPQCGGERVESIACWQFPDD
ncbi:MAG: hypothetical protein IGQ88_05130 [Gloeomargaritaceae cyanobacterium C42_A2020_066]|nr:hypothetical protein [Gloeomargaritaceae cyanobacterium C42_A2020_066]